MIMQGLLICKMGLKSNKQRPRTKHLLVQCIHEQPRVGGEETHTATVYKIQLLPDSTSSSQMGSAATGRQHCITKPVHTGQSPPPARGQGDISPLIQRFTIQLPNTEQLSSLPGVRTSTPGSTPGTWLHALKQVIVVTCGGSTCRSVFRLHLVFPKGKCREHNQNCS